MAYTKDPPTHGKKPPCYGPHGGMGDIGGDGRVAADDVQMMGMASVGEMELSMKEAARADLDGNGEPADAVDVTTLNQFVVGNIDTFPTCSKYGYTKDPPTYGKNPPCYGPHGGMGDIGGDGRIASDDSQMMGMASIGEMELSMKEAARADLDGNGNPADAVDVTTINQFIVGDIDVFSVCGTAAPPGMETRTMSLEEGKSYSIEVQLSNYEVLKATIRVTSSGIICETVTGGACGGSALPRIDTSGWVVTTHLKATSGGGNYSEWVDSKGGLSGVELDDIFELKDAFIGLAEIGFAPILSQIMECKDAFIGL